MAEIKYVSQANLSRILGKIKDTYVAQVAGKGLSTNDLTNELVEKINTASAANHSHTNLELLDTYTQTEANLASAVAQMHTHANADELALIASGDKAKWDQAVTDVGVLKGNSSVEGSVDKKIADAINKFATDVSADGTVNTYKELIEYAASHGAEFTELVGEVDANTAAIATLNGNAQTAGSVAKAVADVVTPVDTRVQAIEAKVSGYDTAVTDVAAIKADYVKASEMVAFTDGEIDDIWNAAIA